MILTIYTIYDRLTGQFHNPFYQINDASAKRFYKNICDADTNKGFSSDWQLFKLGTFNVESGEIIAFKPDYIMGAVDNE